MLKKIVLELLKYIFDRRLLVRFSRALMNSVSGDNNESIRQNGECVLLSHILNFLAEEKEFIIFDVGANSGTWTCCLLDIIFKKRIDKKITVYCFEPSVYAFSELQKNIAASPSAHIVHSVNIGISDAVGTGLLYSDRRGAGTSSFYKRRIRDCGISFDKTEVIQATTLDIYCRTQGIDRIKFLKVDVEGHELAVLRGAQDMLRKCNIDFIQFEYGGSWIDSRTLLLDMYDLMSSFGYVIGKILPAGIEFYDVYDQRIETFQMANFLACRRDYANRFNRIEPWWKE